MWGIGIGTSFSRKRNGVRGVLDEEYLLGLEEIMEVVELLKRDVNEYSIRFNRKRLTVDEMVVMVVETRQRAKTMNRLLLWVNVHRDRALLPLQFDLSERNSINVTSVHRGLVHLLRLFYRLDWHRSIPAL